jgi:hypothetical protein
MTWDGRVPFDKEGNQLVYASYYGENDWRPNDPFEATLEYVTYFRGRSACDMVFRNVDTGGELTFNMPSFEDLIPHMVNGRVTGKFAFKKRGANYTCYLVESPRMAIFDLKTGEVDHVEVVIKPVCNPNVRISE